MNVGFKIKKMYIHVQTDYFPGFLFSCNFVAARFLIFCSLLSALIRDVLPIELLLDEELLLLLEELVDLLTPLLPGFCGTVCCLLKLVNSPEEFFPLTELGESDRLLWKVMGLSLLLLDFGRVVVFFIDLLQSEQKNTDLGSLTSASLMEG